MAPVLIIIPMRHREAATALALRRLEGHSLPYHGIRNYTIVVLEQVDTFTSVAEEPWNKGRLYNSAIAHLNPPDDVSILFHDADVGEIVNGSLNYAACADPPIATQLFGHTHRGIILGGLFCMTAADYRRTGGFSNQFEGWGCEDRDFGGRVEAAGVEVDRNVTVRRNRDNLETVDGHEEHGLAFNLSERLKNDDLVGLNPDDGLATVTYTIVAQTSITARATRWLVGLPYTPKERQKASEERGELDAEQLKAELAARVEAMEMERTKHGEGGFKRKGDKLPPSS